VLALTRPAPPDDAELIDAILAEGVEVGVREEAFRALVERYEERIFRLLARFARDRAEAEDLTQEVFVKLFRKLHTFQQDSAFYTWLYRIAINTATDWLSRQRRRRLHLVDEWESIERGGRNEAGSDEPLLEAELRQVTRQVLETLPDKYRTILVLREYEDLSYQQMAEVLRCSIGTVESRLFRARQRFRVALERMHPELVPGLRTRPEGAKR
jgi:RNA polymerase sigma factor (sigma-70 family)